MEWIAPAAALVIGLVLGAAAAYFAARARSAKEQAVRMSEAAADRSLAGEKARRLEEAEAELKRIIEETARLREDNARLAATIEEERKTAAEKLALLDDAKDKLTDSFKALAADALKGNTESFLELAKTSFEKARSENRGELDKRKQAVEELVKPIKDSLAKFDENVRSIETRREGAYKELREQVRSLHDSQEKLETETAGLVRALRRPEVRGRWGEITLRRVAELAGMVEHCDFTQQESMDTEEGRLRPDMVVKLPGRRRIIIDAKTPFDAFLAATEAKTDEERARHLERHARQVRDQIANLSRKEYWDACDESPLFVVMFMPAESFLRAAIDKYPELLEEGFKKKVIIATPPTLISLMLTIAHGWREEKLAKGAMEIRDLGRQLYERISTLAEHFKDLHKGLKKSVEAYNKAIGSLESRVLVSARKFKELGAAPSGEIVELGTVDVTPRELAPPEADCEKQESA
jgi:DNA recombination protein RmuC